MGADAEDISKSAHAFPPLAETFTFSTEIADSSITDTLTSKGCDIKEFSTGPPVISSDHCAGIEILTDCKTIIVSVHYNATFVNKTKELRCHGATQQENCLAS